MVTLVAPYAIFFGVSAAVALLFHTFWARITNVLTPYLTGYRRGLERAAMQVSSEQLLLGIVGAGVGLWLAYMVVVKPDLVRGLLVLPITMSLSVIGCKVWIDTRIRARLESFNQQLELVLRLISSGLRVGLGLRQAFVIVIEEMPDPARTEFRTVIGQTNIGIPIYDALDRLAERMPSSEIIMMVRAIRIQSQTGGNLGKVLDNLASTIKDRRRIARKVKALSAEARMSGYVITALPVLVGVFILVAEPHMRESLLSTKIGHVVMLIVVLLEGLGGFVLNRMMKFRV